VFSFFSERKRTVIASGDHDAHYLANMKQIKVFATFVPLVEVWSSGP